MDRGLAIGLISVVGIVVVVFIALGVSWFQTRRSQSDLTAPPTPPQLGLGPATFSTDAFYVATTLADAPTERILVHGLAFRGRAHLAVHLTGVVVSIAGRKDFFISRVATWGVGRATWAIDKVVERDGLIFLRWRLDNSEVVDTYLRSHDPDALLTALLTIAPASKESA